MNTRDSVVDASKESIDWNDKSSFVGVMKLVEDFQKLSEDQESADTVFLLDKNEERVYAHKVILMAR